MEVSKVNLATVVEGDQKVPCNCLTREEKKLILVNHEESKSYSEFAGTVRK